MPAEVVAGALLHDRALDIVFRVESVDETGLIPRARLKLEYVLRKHFGTTRPADQREWLESQTKWQNEVTCAAACSSLSESDLAKMKERKE